MRGYYHVNPHGHTTSGIQWDGLDRAGERLSLQEVIDAAKKEFKDISADKLYLWPGAGGSFALGVSDRPSDQTLKTLADLIKNVKEEYKSEKFEKYFIAAYEHGVFVEPDYPLEG